MCSDEVTRTCQCRFWRWGFQPPAGIFRNSWWGHSDPANDSNEETPFHGGCPFPSQRCPSTRWYLLRGWGHQTCPCHPHSRRSVLTERWDETLADSWPLLVMLNEPLRSFPEPLISKEFVCGILRTSQVRYILCWIKKQDNVQVEKGQEGFFLHCNSQYLIAAYSCDGCMERWHQIWCTTCLLTFHPCKVRQGPPHYRTM